MTIYFMGSEMGAFIPADSTANDSANFADSGFTRGSVFSGTSSAYSESATFAAPDDFWIHGQTGYGDGGGGVSTLLECSASGTGVFRLRGNTTSVQMQALIGGVWTDIGSAVSWSAYNTSQTIDVHIVGNSGTGTAELYLAGTLRASATANLSAVTGVTTIRNYGGSIIGGTFLSQVIVADEPTIGWRLMTFYPSGAGATGDWTGDYTNVDEAIYSDSDFIYSATNGQVELFTGTAAGSLTGYTLRAVGVYARAKRGAAGPANLQLALRVNGTTYPSTSKALGLGYGAYGAVWETNPDTGVDWLNTQLATTQFGVKAIT